jgi:hypothetical protein
MERRDTGERRVRPLVLRRVRFGNYSADLASILKRAIMSEENIDDLNKDNCPTFAAFLEQMAAHNAEQLAEFSPDAVCPTCGKIHEYTFPYAAKTASPPVA